MDYFLTDDQIATQSRHELPPTTINPRKRKAPIPNGPRRSARKTNTVDRPGFVSNVLSDDNFSDQSPVAPLEQSIERNEEVNQECLLETIRPGDTMASRKVDTDLSEASPSVKMARKIPMPPITKSTKPLVSKPGKRKPSSPSVTRESVVNSSGFIGDSPTGVSPPGRKVLNFKAPWNMPSTKAQSKPLGKSLSAVIHAMTPPNQDADSTNRGSSNSHGGEDSSPHRSPPRTPMNESSRLRPLTPAIQGIFTPTSLPHPSASDILQTPISTLKSPLNNFQTWVVTSSSIRTEERLRGVHFAEMSLSSFLSGIAKLTGRPVDGICKMKLTLEMQCLITIDTVWRGQDEVWTEIKETFAEKLSLRRRGEKCKMVVEPSWEETNGSDVKAANISEGEDGLYDA